VKRLYAWFAGVAGGAAVYRALKRQPPPAPQEPSPADDLRAKLAEARAAGDDRAEFQAGETPVDEVVDVEERRRSVHDQARAAIDEMKRE
jgi:acetyl-CoA carboxylase carboxyltransferase component